MDPSKIIRIMEKAEKIQIEKSPLGG